MSKLPYCPVRALGGAQCLRGKLLAHYWADLVHLPHKGIFLAHWLQQEEGLTDIPLLAKRCNSYFGGAFPCESFQKIIYRKCPEVEAWVNHLLWLALADDASDKIDWINVSDAFCGKILNSSFTHISRVKDQAIDADALAKFIIVLRTDRDSGGFFHRLCAARYVYSTLVAACSQRPLLFIAIDIFRQLDSLYRAGVFGDYEIVGFPRYEVEFIEEVEHIEELVEMAAACHLIHGEAEAGLIIAAFLGYKHDQRAAYEDLVEVTEREVSFYRYPRLVAIYERVFRARRQLQEKRGE